MKKCYDCNKKIKFGFVAMEENIVFCERCYEKMYTYDEIKDMWENGQCYWTEFEGEE